MTSRPATTSLTAPSTQDWGRTNYRAACDRQAAMVAQRIEGTIGDTLVFTEHEPVFTIGMRGGAGTHLLWNEQQLALAGIAVEKTNRGGDITYHGPGQIVGYPILSLTERPDLHAYLRLLEQVVIASLHSFGLTAARREGKTGIWVGRRKIAAIGVAVRRWVTYHGFALNLDPDLSHFDGIVPCGISAAEGTVTSMRTELGRAPEAMEVKAVLVREFREQWQRFCAGADPD